MQISIPLPINFHDSRFCEIKGGERKEYNSFLHVKKKSVYMQLTPK